MILFDVHHILPALILDLPPRHKEIAAYLLSLSGKRQSTYAHAQRTWGMTRNQWRDELASTLMALRNGLRRHGIYRLSDIEAG